MMVRDKLDVVWVGTWNLKGTAAAALAFSNCFSGAADFSVNSSQMPFPCPAGVAAD